MLIPHYKYTFLGRVSSRLLLLTSKHSSSSTLGMKIPQNLPSKEPNISSILKLEGQKTVETLETEVEIVDYSQRGQWLRAAVLGANDGLLSTASLMMGVGAVRKDSKTMIVTGVAGMVAGACSMAIGELVSVYSQYDIEMAQIRRESKGREVSEREIEEKTRKLPNPLKAAAASGMAFSVGAFVPLVAASFIRDYSARLAAVVAAVSLTLLVFGGLGAVLGKAPLLKSLLRVLLGGWFAMSITFGFTKLMGRAGL